MKSLFIVCNLEENYGMTVYDSKEEFVENFKWLLQNANKLGYYEPVNYQKSPITYCGVKVTNNPYYG